MIPVRIRDVEGKERTERCLLDSGAEHSCILQSLVIDCGFEPQDSDIGLVTIDGKDVFSYGSHSIELESTDSEESLRRTRDAFVACDIEFLAFR